MKLYLFIGCVWMLCSCEKYLDVKPDRSLVVPMTLFDLEALLNNSDQMNSAYAVIQESATDNAYLESTRWKNLTSLTAKNCYIWDDDLFNDSERNEWSYSYVRINYCNLILDRLAENKEASNKKELIRGEALFFRAMSFYQLVDLFAKPFDKNTAATDPGIPLRLTSDINEKFTRASVQACYDRIIDDLKETLPILPTVSVHKSRPSRTATYALLARLFLNMQRYEEAKTMTDSCLYYADQLMDYKNISPGTATSFPLVRYNDEVIFHSTSFGRPSLNVTNGRVDMELVNSYKPNDLRKHLFLRSQGSLYSFRGSYDGSSVLFTGLSTNEIYLIKAECEVRLGNNQKGLEILNHLLQFRYDSTFVPYADLDSGQLLNIILQERRKELVFRGLRWSDLRRLNKDPRFAKVITRELDGAVYKLEPNSGKYVLPIPTAVIVNTGIEQNR